MEIPKTTEWDAYRLDTRVPQIAYGHWLKFFYGYYDKAEAFLMSLIKARGCRTVLEVGAGANPTLSGSQIKALGLRYITSDVDQAELDKAAQPGEARCVDLEGDDLPADIVGNCDLVFSKMVNEHVRDGEKYHTNIRHLLSPNGLAVHLSASLFSLPFVVNRLVPDSVSDMLLRLFAPRDRHQHGKF
ncbi:MAG: methyltransferase domain-containing protein, partial [Acetobacteraceae bacterium]|nr:methyltransferase domain-containing protein [Acetobacteraceae bacterium]